MATYRKRGAVWQVQVNRLGVRKSASFRTKAEAERWAAKAEAEIFAGAKGDVLDKSVAEVLERYRDEVSITKRGERWERLRIGLFLRDPLADVRLPRLTAVDVADWRDRRLRQVSALSVLREWCLLNHVFNVAIKEWRWIKQNPMAGVTRPKPPPARDRRIGQAETDALLLALGYTEQQRPETITARVGAAYLFAIETAMRAGEMCSLEWSDIKGAVARLHRTKNGFPRDVPLSPAALAVLARLPRDSAHVFGLTVRQVDALFRKAKAKAMIGDLHFHDTRHEAITRLARKLDVLDLARMVGHRDLRMLMVYYNANASEIAERLAVGETSPVTRLTDIRNRPAIHTHCATI